MVGASASDPTEKVADIRLVGPSRDLKIEVAVALGAIVFGFLVLMMAEIAVGFVAIVRRVVWIGRLHRSSRGRYFLGVVAAHTNVGLRRFGRFLIGMTGRAC